ncbi:Mor transcription activator family protein [Clostridium amazonitimonense]|uniref:Mor transcription activator family protein n=1 Tax=Clostridium amazonitimonense TaxID=1499689 RepID=UPI000509733C|nr:Mor transcription activator family protein [Clostridium amazonitimonense]
MDGWIKDLTVDMIPEGPYRDIADTIGVVNFIKLAEFVGGSTIYIPKADSFLRPARDLNIKKEFNGYNHSDLAKKYNLSERWIREICGEGHLEGQITLFGNEENHV